MKAKALAPNSQFTNEEKMFLKEIKSATPVNKQMISETAQWFGQEIKLRESIPKQVDKKSGCPQGERGLEFSRRRKEQTCFPLYTPQDYIAVIHPA